jgi:hypothetical protein
MVIQETLRLYPPASLMMREALSDIRMGGLDVPRGTIIQVARLMLHLDEDAWGPDAGEFRPGRIANGVAAACKPAHVYMKGKCHRFLLHQQRACFTSSTARRRKLPTEDGLVLLLAPHPNASSLHYQG